MKRLLCLLLTLAVLLPLGAAPAEGEGWKHLDNGIISISYPGNMLVYSVPAEDSGWEMDVIEDPDAADAAGSPVSMIIFPADIEDWMDWLNTGAFPDVTGRGEAMRDITPEDYPVDPDNGLDMTYALFQSADGQRMLEACIFYNEESDVQFLAVSRFPAENSEAYSGVFHAMVETLTFGDVFGSSEASNARGSFRVVDRWDYDGWHTVVKDVTVDRESIHIYWIYAETDVTGFKIEKLTWNDDTFTVKKAKSLYTKKKLAEDEVVAVYAWEPEILPTWRFRAVNQEGEEEIWYVTTNEENGSILLLSEEDMAY